MYTLYYRPECPYCKKVVEFIDEGDIKMDMRDTNKKENSEALIKKGGKKQVRLFLNVKLIDVATSEVVASEDAEISKDAKRSLFERAGGR